MANNDETFRKSPPGQGAARKQMAEVLKRSREELKKENLTAHYFVHVNRDGSIDAELSVKEPRGKHPLDLFEPLRESLPDYMPGFWISTGARFEATRAEENYHRHKSGLSQAQAYYQLFEETPPTREGRKRGTAGLKAAYNMLVGQEISETLEKRQRKKIDGVFVRLHWNPANEQPGRATVRRDRKKAKKRKAKKGKTSRKSPKKG